MTPTRATLCIDASAWQHNLQVVRAFAPSKKIAAVIKANAYGHGVALAAKALASADAFMVVTQEEALALRALCDKPIVMLAGVYDASSLQVLIDHNITPVIHCQEQIDLCSSVRQTKPVTVWLKIDSGMHRYGLTAQAYQNALQVLPQAGYFVSVSMSHLADSANLNHDSVKSQKHYFDQATLALWHDNRQLCQHELSLAASAAICAYPDTHYQWVRPGIMLYGGNPFGTQTHAVVEQLKPVMTLTSSVMALRTIACGQSVGYGSLWTAKQDSVIASVGIGYGDGYPRTIDQGEVLLHGQRAPIVGRVSMDTITVDVTDVVQIQKQSVAVGDEVLLWGRSLQGELSADWVAEQAGTISYELFCQLTPRVRRIEK